MPALRTRAVPPVPAPSGANGSSSPPSLSPSLSPSPRRPQRKMTPLHLASWNNQAEVAAFLISRGVNLNAREDDGEAALHLAARKGNPEILKLLMAAKADPEVKDKARGALYAASEPWNACAALHRLCLFRASCAGRLLSSTFS